MTADILVIAVLAGAANWVFRVVPTRMDFAVFPPGGRLARFLAATGPAAICTLFVASILPELYPVPPHIVSLTFGLGTVGATFAAFRSVAGATLAGAVAYGLVFALFN